MITKNLRKFGFVAVILILSLLIYVAQNLIVDPTSNFNSKSASLQCNFINLECHFSINNQPAFARFDVYPVPEESISLTLTLPESADIDSAWIEGVNMYMGKIPVLIEPTSGGQWEGWFMLGSCSEPVMQWRLILNLKGRENPALLYFTTEPVTSVTASS